jgi:hypothetical protein
MDQLACLVLLGPRGASKAEGWVYEGQLAATLDLVERLQAVPQVARITLMAPDLSDFPLQRQSKLALEQTSPSKFEFGPTLLSWAEAQQGMALAYFGGASAPLLTPGKLAPLVDLLLQEDGPQAITNNKYSSDWLLMRQIHGAEDFLAGLESDNPLGWGLENQVGLQVHGLAPGSMSRTDIDTPWDLLMLKDHPEVGPVLSDWLSTVDSELSERVAGIKNLLATPAQTLMVIGRSSAATWSMLEKRTQVWTRWLVEERGMLASGRFRRGEVKSLIANHIERVGLAPFMAEAASMSDGLLWDNRVWLACSGGWPDRGQRFAADLGWRDELHDRRLLELVSAVEPLDSLVVCGGHGVVSGGLMALLDNLPGGDYQPSR